MKKLIIACLAFGGFIIPSIAQVDHDYSANDLVPVEKFELTKDQIPPVVLKAVNTEFTMNNPHSWTKFPYNLKEYGWVYDKSTSDVKPDLYEVNMKTNTGNEFFAVYSKDGNLVATREMSVNIPVPPAVKEALLKSKYKDWTIVGTKEKIRYYHDKKNVVQHFRVTVEKDNVKRSISFNFEATANK